MNLKLLNTILSLDTNYATPQTSLIPSRKRKSRTKSEQFLHQTQFKMCPVPKRRRISYDQAFQTISFSSAMSPIYLPPALSQKQPSISIHESSSSSDSATSNFAENINGFQDPPVFYLGIDDQGEVSRELRLRDNQVPLLINPNAARVEQSVEISRDCVSTNCLQLSSVSGAN